MLSWDQANKTFNLQLFGKNGQLSGPPVSLSKGAQATYDAEFLFNLDLNRDSVQGRNIHQLDESSFHKTNRLNLFQGTNNTILLQDFNSKQLLVAPSSSPDRRRELSNADGSVYSLSATQTVVAVDTDSDGRINLLSWDQADQTFTLQLFGENGLRTGSPIALGGQDQSTFAAERLFALDLNKDQIQGEPVTVSEFDIAFNYSTNIADDYKKYFLSSAKLWSDIIVGDLPDVEIVVNGEKTIIDDVLVDVDLFNDPNSNVLGWARPLGIRVDWPNRSAGLTTQGEMAFNLHYIDQMIDSGSFAAVITHEIAHILGFGTLWNDPFLEKGLFSSAPWNQYGKGPMVDDNFNYLGKYAVEAYSNALGEQQASVPIEDGSSAPGAGSVGSHWKEGTFDDELMTPISNGSNSMGDMTIAAMQDLGYQINPIETKIRTQLEKGIWDGEDQLHNFQSGGLVFDNTPFAPSVNALDVAGLPEISPQD